MRWIPLLVLLACQKDDAPPVDNGPEDADQDGFDIDSDCDDTDPLVHPGATDLWSDGVDADCDDEDRVEFELSDLPLTVSSGPPGTLRNVGMAVCDVTWDGADDLVVGRGSAPGGARIGVFAGPLAPAKLALSDADVELVLADLEVGSIFCDDVDGDGADDLVLEVIGDGRGGGPVGIGVAVMYQPAGGLTAAIAAPDALLAAPVDAESFLSRLAVGDFDGDGSADAVWGRSYWEGSYPTFYWLGGGTYAGELALEDQAVPVTHHHEMLGFTSSDFSRYLFNAGDMDGDGDPEVGICGLAEPRCVIADHLGGGDLLTAALHTAGAGDDLVAGDFTVGDFNGDGARDDVAFGFRESLWVATDALGEVALPVSADAHQAVFLGNVAAMHVRNAGDVDGDGADDIAIAVSAHTEGWHAFRVISGAALAATNSVIYVDEVTLLAAQRSSEDGRNAVVWVDFGDLDGDGLDDVVFTSAGSDSKGTVGAWLTSGFRTGG